MSLEWRDERPAVQVVGWGDTGSGLSLKHLLKINVNIKHMFIPCCLKDERLGERFIFQPMVIELDQDNKITMLISNIILFL